MTNLHWHRLTHIVALLKSISMFFETEKTSSRGSSLMLLKSLVCGSFSLKDPHLIGEKKIPSRFLQKGCICRLILLTLTGTSPFSSLALLPAF